MSFCKEQMTYTTLLVRIRWDIYTFQFQLILQLLTIFLWITVLQIFVKIHIGITYSRKKNEAPVMMNLVTIVKQTLLSTPAFE